MRALELLRMLDERSFVALCAVLLKEEVSPRVRLVSIAGPDGGRDAVFEGAAASYPDWDGQWLFQFKHYRHDAAAAQRRVLRDLERGVTEARASYPQLSNYVLITSVPFTGTPGTGSFDRTQAACDRLQAETGLQVDVWDGLEVTSLVAMHPMANAMLQSTDRSPLSPPSELEQLGLTKLQLRELTDDGLARYVSLLVASPLDPLGPEATSPVALAVYRGAFPAIRAIVPPVVQQVAKRERDCLSPEVRYWTDWLTLAVSLAEARTGAVTAAVRRARDVIRRVGAADLQAWAYNVLSLAYGKLEDRLRYEKATSMAIQRALEASNYWLASTVGMRSIHKLDWAAGESGVPLEDNQFLELTMSAAAKGNDDRINALEAAHLRGQIQAYLALHHRWNSERSSEAEDALRSADGYFRKARDQSELTRLDTESGLLERQRSPASDRALTKLQAALSRRISSGELPRARYDLLWLGEVHAARGATVEAEVCAWWGLGLHRTLYGARDVDTRIVQKLRRLAGATPLTLRRRAVGGRLTDDGIFDAIAVATDLPETEILRYVDPATIRAEVVAAPVE